MWRDEYLVFADYASYARCQAIVKAIEAASRALIPIAVEMKDCNAGNSRTWQRFLEESLYESDRLASAHPLQQAQAVVRPSLPERDLLAAWN